MMKKEPPGEEPREEEATRKPFRPSQSLRKFMEEDGLLSTMNKADLVWHYMHEHPDEGRQEIQRGMRDQGVDVSLSYIDQLRKQFRDSRSGNGAQSNSSDEHVSFEFLEFAKAVEKVGGIESARSALETLNQLKA